MSTYQVHIAGENSVRRLQKSKQNLWRPTAEEPIIVWWNPKRHGLYGSCLHNGWICCRSLAPASLPADYYSPSLREDSEKLVCRVVILMASRVTLGRLQSCIFKIIFTQLLTNQRDCKNECHNLHFDVHWCTPQGTQGTSHLWHKKSLCQLVIGF